MNPGAPHSAVTGFPSHPEAVKDDCCFGKGGNRLVLSLNLGLGCLLVAGAILLRG